MTKTDTENNGRNGYQMYASGDPTSKLWVFRRTVVPTETAVQKS
jgi:hypothetical protein